MATIEPMDELSKLSLAGTRHPDAGAARLAGLIRLRRPRLGNTPISIGPLAASCFGTPYALIVCSDMLYRVAHPTRSTKEGTL